MLRFFMLIVAMSMCNGGEITKREEMKFMYKEQCGYLPNDIQNPRHNAFYILEKGYFCCMCPNGHKYTGNCDDGRPQNTRCEICRSGTNITFEPHVEDECKPITCSRGKRYDINLKKCQCPLGKVETKSGKLCRKAKHSKQKQADVTSTPKQTTSGKMSTMKTRNGRADVNPTTHPGPLINSSPGQITDGKTLTEKPSAETLLMATSTIIETLISNRSSKNSRVKSSTTTNGLSSTRPTEDTGQMSYKERDKSSTSAFSTARGFSETKVPAASGDWKLPVFIAISLIVILTIAAVVILNRYCQKKDEKWTSMICFWKFKKEDENDRKVSPNESAEALIVDERENTPQQTSDGIQGLNDSRDESVGLIPNTVQKSQIINLEDPEPPNESVPEEPSCHDDSYWEQKALLIPKVKHKKFAREVARQLGREVSKEGARAMFRDIVENFQENRLKDIDKSEKSTENFIYDLMEYARESVGKELTPFYLWKKIKQRSYIKHQEIVEDIINDFTESKRK